VLRRSVNLACVKMDYQMAWRRYARSAKFLSTTVPKFSFGTRTLADPLGLKSKLPFAQGQSWQCDGTQ
jgi:hypothetical protein